MNMNTAARRAVTTVRRHPGRALAICVPVVAASVFAGTTMASAAPEATLAVPATALTATPAPYVPNFADDPTGARVPALPHRTAVPVAWNVDGCDHDYGSPNQCVPWQIPGATGAAKCAWLTSNGFGSLKVYGVNRQHLPENAAGYICASGG